MLFADVYDMAFDAAFAATRLFRCLMPRCHYATLFAFSLCLYRATPAPPMIHADAAACLFTPITTSPPSMLLFRRLAAAH